MYFWIRNTHLFLGLFCLLSLLVYGTSSVQMAHHDWFSLQPAVTEARVAVSLDAAASARALARALMDEHQVRGELAQVREAPDGYHFRIVRPGVVAEVNYSRLAGEARIRTSTANFIGMLNRVHHLGGLWHEYALLNVWGVLVGIVSAALLVLGLSGIYLWFQFHNERAVGVVLLAGSLGYAITLAVLLRIA